MQEGQSGVKKRGHQHISGKQEVDSVFSVLFDSRNLRHARLLWYLDRLDRVRSLPRIEAAAQRRRLETKGS